MKRHTPPALRAMENDADSLQQPATERQETAVTQKGNAPERREDSKKTWQRDETEGDDGQHGSLPYRRQSAEDDGCDKKRNAQTKHPDDAGNIRVVGNTPGCKQQRKVLSNRVLFLGRAMTAEKSDTGTKSVPKKGTLPPGLAKSGNKSRGREILFHRRQLLKLSCDTREVWETPDGDCVGIACPEPGLFHCLEMSPRSSLAPCAPELTVLVEAMKMLLTPARSSFSPSPWIC